MNVSEAVREICLSFPETEETESHSMMNFRVRGKTFATYAINHHGDGRVALWLEALPGSQDLYTKMESEHYFVPQYVGPKGWLGVQLNTGLSWDSVIKRVSEAYEKVAPSELTGTVNANVNLEEPIEPLSAEEIDPLLQAHAQQVLKRLTEYCRLLPETLQARQFGNPVWKAGKKTFACVHRYNKRLCLQVWVGVDQQSFLVTDDRYKIPPYVGHNGWIDLDVEQQADWKEIESLVVNSYRHFALKRMLKQLEATA
jgi:predicted DNA-binding protein (MmcQ/YjbR family)